MRILVVHNRYRSDVPSGENQVVDDEIELLRAAGHDVTAYLPSSDDIDEFGPTALLTLPLRPVHSRVASRQLDQLIRSNRPEVVHLHNPFPLVSPSVVRVAQRHGVPVVQTVHNYRHTCLAGTLFRDGHVCEDCLGKRVPLPGVVHGCYRGSRLQSVPMATAQAVHRATWRQVERFLPLTEFMAAKLVAAGLPADRMLVRPNSAPDPGPAGAPGADFLYAGRFDLEKGILLLVRAWERAALSDRQLVVVGDGELRDDVRRAAAEVPGIILTGSLTRDEVSRRMAQSGVVVVPSLCYEGFPRVVVEAFAHGRPVVASALGAMTELVDASVGWTAAPDPEPLAAALRAAAAADLAPYAAAARDRYLARYTPQRGLDQLLDVYRAVSR